MATSVSMLETVTPVVFNSRCRTVSESINNFEVKLPHEIKDVCAIRLADMTFPRTQPIISGRSIVWQEEGPGNDTTVTTLSFNDCDCSYSDLLTGLADLMTNNSPNGWTYAASDGGTITADAGNLFTFHPQTPSVSAQPVLAHTATTVTFYHNSDTYPVGLVGSFAKLAGDPLLNDRVAEITAFSYVTAGSGMNVTLTLSLAGASTMALTDLAPVVDGATTVTVIPATVTTADFHERIKTSILYELGYDLTQPFRFENTYSAAHPSRMKGDEALFVRMEVNGHEVGQVITGGSTPSSPYCFLARVSLMTGHMGTSYSIQLPWMAKLSEKTRMDRFRLSLYRNVCNTFVPYDTRGQDFDGLVQIISESRRLQ